MTRPAPIPDALRGGPFSSQQALRLISPDDLRGSSYRRLLRGAHITAASQISHQERILAARQVLPANAVLGGVSAMWALGAPVAGSDEPVDVVLPPERRVRNREGLRVRGDVLGPHEVVQTPLGAATSPARTAFDLARAGRPYRTVPLLDALGRATGLSSSDVEAVAAQHPGARWLSRLSPALGLMDAGAESIRESQLRYLLVTAGLPRPLTQHTIRTSTGSFVARVDLAWPEFRVVVEYDGAHHDERAQVLRDRQRLNAIRLSGWNVLVVDAAQFARPPHVVAMVRAALKAGG